MRILFGSRAWLQYRHWHDNDAAVLAKLNGLIDECCRTPFAGTAKPEPLKDDLKGWWSRRITSEHRLVYRVTGKPPDQMLEIIQCRYHY